MTGEIIRRSPTNVSIVRGLYDGPGGFTDPADTIEAHLQRIESAACVAIKKFALAEPGTHPGIPPEVGRFLAWQAARTPGWMALVEEWINESNFASQSEVVEPPPEGIDQIKDRQQSACLEDPATGQRIEIDDADEIDAYRKRGWKWVLRRNDHLQMLHLQAWHFQVRHFPRLSWARLGRVLN